MSTAFLPNLLPSDVEQAAQLIQRTYNTIGLPSEEQKRLQQELFDIQKRPEAWGLVIPFLEHQDPNVQFFGAHTAQVKIARDWDAFPKDHVQDLRDLLVQLAAHAAATGRNRVIIRKLFVALTSLALILVPGSPTRWPDWLLSCVAALSGRGASPEHILDFLSIVAEDIETAVLSGPSKMQVRQSLNDAIPMVVQAITASITKAHSDTGSVKELHAALRCFTSWLVFFPMSDVTPLIPGLINLLGPSVDEDTFIASSDTLQAILTSSALSNGAGTKTLTEPLLLWLESYGALIVDETVQSGIVEPRSHSLCKLLVALGDHSTSYMAVNLASTSPISPLASAAQLSLPTNSQVHPQGRLVQSFLRRLLAYTGLPGYYGMDEEESEMTLGFWYLFQEALWSTDFEAGDEDTASSAQASQTENAVIALSKAVYSELVQVLRRKIVWPPSLAGWTKDQVDKFQVYRRDVGDTLINAYYVLRDDMLNFLINDLLNRLATKQPAEGWQEIEATLHCIMSIQEAIDLENTPSLARMFTEEVLTCLPTSGYDRVRKTMLSLIGTYSSWFAAQPTAQTPAMLMNVVGYIATALSESTLSLWAANAMRDICDANRAALAPNLGAFAQLHAALADIADTEKSKVLQSIASVIQALPPPEEISPIEAIINPVVAKLAAALQSPSQLPEEARAMVVIELEALCGIAKGLTRTNDALVVLEESSDPQVEEEIMQQARADPRMVKLRDDIFAGIRTVMEVWSVDAEVNTALSDLLKSITALPADLTLISLSPGPLLEQVCLAAQRRLNGIWLTLAGMLIAQLNPPPALMSLKTGPTPEAKAIVSSMLPVLLQAALGALAQPNALQENPDVVRDFFGCMDTVAHNFAGAFFSLPQGMLDMLMQCAVTSMELQERYALVAACTFLGALFNRVFIHEELEAARNQLVQRHGKIVLATVLRGFAGIAPRSAVPNLIDLLSTLVSRCTAECRQWMGDILFADDFLASKAGHEAKMKFVRAVTSSRSLKRTREAAQQFMLVARGLEGSNFGYATLTM
ncbi:hypothetical protein HGRIS_006706 [Hohenbuehelia grisea]|uniref:Importin-13 n=1 Tax=Hohenbuehelia grisea TaxID=104357 RepID=A0ABR3J9V4_9AGAR